MHARGFAMIVRCLAMAALFCAAPLFAQAPTYANPNEGFMPGTPVGKPMVEAVGTRLPSVGTQLPKVGKPLDGKPSTKPFDGSAPKVDPNLVVAPFPTPNEEPENFWDKLYRRWSVIFDSPDERPPSGYIPSFSRRARERNRERQREEMMRRWRG